MQESAAINDHWTPGRTAVPSEGRRRVTAESFRSLTARLRRECVIPDLVPPPAPAPESVATPPHAAPTEPAPIEALPADPGAETPPPPDSPVQFQAEFESDEPEPAGESAAPPPRALPSFPEFGAWPTFAPLPPLADETTAPSAPADIEADAAPEPAAEAATVPEEAPEWTGPEYGAAAELPEVLNSAAAELAVAPPEYAPEPPAAVLEALQDEPAEVALADEPPATPAGAASEPAEPAIDAGQPDLAAGEPPAESAAGEPDLAATQPPAAAASALPEPATVAEPAVADAPHSVALREAPGIAAKAPRTASPLADKVVEALVKTVTEAVYAKPSAAERAAFLRDVADLVERDTAAAGDIPARALEAVPLDGLRKTVKDDDEVDPFAAGVQARLNPPRPAELPEADEDTGELALSLLEMMSGGSAWSQPQERALAADTLLRLVSKIPVRQLLTIAERVAIMEVPPSLLVARLIRDPRPEIAAPLLERCAQISDHDLMLAASEGDVHKQRMLARRRVLSPALSDMLISRGDASVILTLVRNPGAALNHETFYTLAEYAISHEGLLAPLTTRADLPAPVAFELFWHVPQELRRFIFSRFLTDSENLNRILKITLSTQGDAGAETKFPEREAVEACIAEVVAGALDSAAATLGDLAGIAADTALRILADRDGEPLAVVMKAVGYPRAKFGEALEALQKGEVQSLRADRKLEELQSIFDTLSFNKARILLTYWDWFISKSGPYAPHH